MAPSGRSQDVTGDYQLAARQQVTDPQNKTYLSENAPSDVPRAPISK